LSARSKLGDLSQLLTFEDLDARKHAALRERQLRAELTWRCRPVSAVRHFPVE
jgi:hypothetical protein